MPAVHSFILGKSSRWQATQLRPSFAARGAASRTVCRHYKQDTDSAAADTVQYGTPKAGTAREAVELQFEVTRKVRVGDCLLVVGSAPELGCWDCSNGVALQWQEGHVWCGTVSVPANTKLTYKIVKVRNGNLTDIEWEHGSDRNLDVFEIPGAKAVVSMEWSDMSAELTLADDQEAHSSPIETAPGSDVEESSGAGDATPVSTEAPDTYIADFAVQKETLMGENLKLVGNVPALGCWNYHAAPAFTWTPGHVWQLSVALPANELVEFKIVLASERDANWCVWQDGENTIVDPTSFSLAPGSVLQVGCTWEGEARATIIDPTVERDGLDDDEAGAASAEALAVNGAAPDAAETPKGFAVLDKVAFSAASDEQWKVTEAPLAQLEALAAAVNEADVAKEKVQKLQQDGAGVNGSAAAETEEVGKTEDVTKEERSTDDVTAAADSTTVDVRDAMAVDNATVDVREELADTQTVDSRDEAATAASVTDPVQATAEPLSEAKETLHDVVAEDASMDSIFAVPDDAKSAWPDATPTAGASGTSTSGAAAVEKPVKEGSNLWPQPAEGFSVDDVMSEAAPVGEITRAEDAEATMEAAAVQSLDLLDSSAPATDPLSVPEAAAWPRVTEEESRSGSSALGEVGPPTPAKSADSGVDAPGKADLWPQAPAAEQHQQSSAPAPPLYTESDGDDGFGDGNAFDTRLMAEQPKEPEESDEDVQEEELMRAADKIAQRLQSENAGVENVVFTSEQLEALMRAGMHDEEMISDEMMETGTIKLQKGRLQVEKDGSTTVVRGGNVYDADTDTVSVSGGVAPVRGAPDGIQDDEDEASFATEPKDLEVASHPIASDAAEPQAVQAASQPTEAPSSRSLPPGMLQNATKAAGVAVAGVAGVALLGGIAVDVADVTLLAGLAGVVSAVGSSQKAPIREKGAAGPALSAFITAAQIAKKIQGSVDTLNAVTGLGKKQADRASTKAVALGKYEKSTIADQSTKKRGRGSRAALGAAAMQAEPSVFERRVAERVLDMRLVLGTAGVAALDRGVQDVMSADVARIIESVDKSLQDGAKVQQLVGMLLNEKPARCRDPRSETIEIAAAMQLSAEYVVQMGDASRSDPLLLAALIISAVDSAHGLNKSG